MTAVDYAALPADDYLVRAHAADLALAARETAACRRPVPAYAGDLLGPTAAWTAREQRLVEQDASVERLDALLADLGRNDGPRNADGRYERAVA